jgi:AcrR family transcriptional regulator
MATTNTKRLTQAERTAISDKRIMSAAIELIAKQGYSKTTLAQIGDQAGYTPGLISHRFGSKDGLLFQLVEMIVATTGRKHIAPAADGLHGLDLVCAYVDAYLAGLTARADRTRALFVLMFESLGPVPALRPFFVKYSQRFRGDFEHAVRAGIEDGDIRPDVDAASEAVAIVGQLRGIAMQWLMDPNCVDPDAIRSSMTAAIRRQLGKPEAGVTSE